MLVYQGVGIGMVWKVVNGRCWWITNEASGYAFIGWNESYEIVCPD